MISSGMYKDVTDRIAQGQIYSSHNSTELAAMDAVLDELSSTEIADVTFYVANMKSVTSYLNSLMVSDVTNSVQPLRDFVLALQRHVTHYVGSVNTFLSFYGLKVKQEFADLSDLVGFPIDEGNIES